jgi:hypothetical protein
MAFLALPVVAKADVFTFSAPTTSPNINPNTNNPNQSDYQGGANQFNLDHHLAYSWRLSGVGVPQGHEITSATLTITNIRNWDSNPNMLFVHLLDTARTYSSSSTGGLGIGWHTPTFNGVTGFIDVALNQAPVLPADIQDAFLSSNPLVAAGTADILLAQQSFNTTASTYTLNLSAAQLAALASYIANGNDFAFGFDADCHFWNNGIVFSFTTAPTATPEPATLFFLGSGLAGFAYLQRRRRRNTR